MGRMKVDINQKDVFVHIKNLEQMDKAVKKELRGKLLDISLRLVDEIKFLMPVRTGRARSSWGKWSNLMVMPNPEVNYEDAIWFEDEDGLAITQGTRVPYVIELNAGSSKQRPMGFIDLSNDRAKRMLEIEGNKITKDITP